MTSITVLVPVLARPHRIKPLLASLQASQADTPLEPLFLASRGDAAEVEALKAAGVPHEVVPWSASDGDWAKKCNHGFRLAVGEGAEWVLLGADDLDFHPGWAEEALRIAERSRCCVIGTNDLYSPRVRTGRHSCHPLVNAGMLECGTIDEDGKILHEGYTHQFPDDELCQTAMFWRTWAFAKQAVVEHLHPNWGKGVTDATYEKGQAGFWQDQALYASRKYLWGR